MKRSEVLKGSFETAVLALLSRQDLHGYDIMKNLREHAGGGILAVKEGTLYPLLHRLETSGFIRGRWEKGSGMRRVRMYTITPAGRRELGERSSLLQAMTTAIAGLLGSKKLGKERG